MGVTRLTPLAEIRAALPPLWHDDFDELEDVARLVMDVNVPVAKEQQDDVLTYLVGIWALAKVVRDEHPIDAAARAMVVDITCQALARIGASPGDQIVSAIQREITANDVWQLPDREAAEALGVGS